MSPFLAGDFVPRLPWKLTTPAMSSPSVKGGFGVPGNPAGDLYAIVRATFPEKLTDEQRELFEKLRSTGL